MLQLRVKPGVGQYQKTIFYKMPKCGHTLSFDYTTPALCQDPDCKEKPEQVDRLVGEHAVGARVRYYAEGKIG